MLADVGKVALTKQPALISPNPKPSASPMLGDVGKVAVALYLAPPHPHPTSTLPLPPLPLPPFSYPTPPLTRWRASQAGVQSTASRFAPRRARLG